MMASKAVDKIGYWSIDESTGTDILMFDNCSVIEGTAAHLVMFMLRENLHVELNKMALRQVELLDANTELVAENAALKDKLDQIKNWCNAYPIELLAEPDWDEVHGILGDTLMSQVSCSNMRQVVDGISKIIEGD